MSFSINKIALLAVVAFSALSTAKAQNGRPAWASLPAATDSVAKVYTRVQYMPLYRGEENTQKLIEDLSRGFRAASAAAGCTAPTFLVVVSLTVGPSGVVQDVRSLNNMPVVSQAEFDAGAKGFVGTRPNLEQLPAACEAALVAAARKLPRLTPGLLNGRRVAVSYTLKLAGAAN